MLFDTRDADRGAARPRRRDPRARHARAAQHPLLARHSRARAGAARPRADQDVLSAEGLPRPLRHRPALGRGDAGRERRRAGRTARRAPATASPRSSSPRTISPAPGRSGRTARRCCRSSPSEPRQREFAFRAGVNIVMYTLTGNYKADQVHIPALLEAAGAVGDLHVELRQSPFAPLVPDIRRVGRRSAIALRARACCWRAGRAARGAIVRTVALALFVLALANPSLTREDRDPLTSVAVVVVDKSPSQEFGDRTQQTEAARAALAERLGQHSRPRGALRRGRPGRRRDRRHAAVHGAGRRALRRAARPRRRRHHDHRRPRA